MTSISSILSRWPPGMVGGQPGTEHRSWPERASKAGEKKTPFGLCADGLHQCDVLEPCAHGIIWKSKGTPLMPFPLNGMMVVNNPLLRFFWGGGIRGVPLDFQDGICYSSFLGRVEVENADHCF